MGAFVQRRPAGGLGLSWLRPLSRDFRSAGLSHAVVVIDDMVKTKHPALTTRVERLLDSYAVRWETASHIHSSPPPVPDEPTLVIGIGGGTAMDVAKFVSWSSAKPSEPAGEGPDGRGIVRPDWRGSGHPLILVPSTIGTGSEVSSPAIAWNDRRPSLVHGPAGQTRFFLLEPQLFETLPLEMALAGVFEIWCRLRCATVDGLAAHPFADGEAARLSRELELLIDRIGGAAEGRSIAILRALAIGQESILGWSLAGRGEQAFRLWYPAMEWAAATRSSKVEALVDLMPSWASTRPVGSTDLEQECRDMIDQCRLQGTGHVVTTEAVDAVFETTAERWFADAEAAVVIDVRAVLDEVAAVVRLPILQESSP